MIFSDVFQAVVLASLHLEFWIEGRLQKLGFGFEKLIAGGREVRQVQVLAATLCRVRHEQYL